jgi:hypothetical protein
MSDFFTANISDADPLISNAIDSEVRGQTVGLGSRTLSFEVFCNN